MPVIPGFERERQEKCELKASLGYATSLGLATGDAVPTKQAKQSKTVKTNFVGGAF